MTDRAHVSSFEALQTLRVALVKFAEQASTALASAESDGLRTLQWLESEQVPFWKAAARKADEELARAQEAYRQKTLFKDASGRQQSAVDEQKAVDRARAKREQCERRAAATKRHINDLRRELLNFRSGTQRLTSFVAQDLPVASARLQQAVDSLQKYAAARAELSGPSSSVPLETGGMSRPEPVEDTPVVPSPDTDDETLRRRTPAPDVRARAPRGQSALTAPLSPRSAPEAVKNSLTDARPGRYDLLTTALPADPAPIAVYLERREPTSPNDTGWHLGNAEPEARHGPVTTMTVARFVADATATADLLRLPVGSLIVAHNGHVTRIVDPLGRVLWQEATEDSPQ